MLVFDTLVSCGQFMINDNVYVFGYTVFSIRELKIPDMTYISTTKPQNFSFAFSV